MAAWIGQYWQAERRGQYDVDDEVSRRRMVELMLGPFIASKPPPLAHVWESDQQPTTLDLLSAANMFNDNMGGCTHIELEPEKPLPSGWEKCLHLKTGSIYYLNRTTGATSASDPRKHAALDKVTDLSSSSTTSELTVEATSNELICNSNANHQRQFLNMNEKPKYDNTRPHGLHEESDLDLNLTLHVGLCSSSMPTTTTLPSRDVGVLTLHPPISPSQIKVATNASAPSTASSSSSSTSSPISASLAFSQTILSSKELSQSPPQRKSSFFKQESNQSTRFATRGSSFYGDLHHSLSDYVQSMGEAGRKLAESEELPSSTAMMTVACANCLMFVMLSRSNPKCPRCGTNCPEQMDFPQPPLKKAKLGFSF